MSKPTVVRARELLKTAVQKLNDGVLVHMGVKLVNSGRPTRNFAEFFSHLNKLQFAPGTVIDVGVAYGTPDLYEAFPTSKFYLVEPLREFEPDLERLKSTYDTEYVLAAAGAAQGEVTLNIHADPRQTTSLARAAVDHRVVPVVTVDQVVAGRDLRTPVMLKIDTEGQELSVLRGAAETLPKVDLVILETRLISYVDGLPEIADIMEHMTGQGFSLYDILDGGYRPLDNALEIVDLVFTRNDSPLRADRRHTSVGTDAW
jgi:FkbM family methyltransferase